VQTLNFGTLGHRFISEWRWDQTSAELPRLISRTDLQKTTRGWARIEPQPVLSGNKTGLKDIPLVSESTGRRSTQSTPQLARRRRSRSTTGFQSSYLNQSQYRGSRSPSSGALRCQSASNFARRITALLPGDETVEPQSGRIRLPAPARPRAWTRHCLELTPNSDFRIRRPSVARCNHRVTPIPTFLTVA
jgi:hypothetical protein